MVHSGDALSFSDTNWLQPLLDEGRRPNLLVLCQRSMAAAVTRRVSAVCGKPLELCLVPGELRLPPRCGTLLLYDVSALTQDQQIALNDWIDASGGLVQVVAVTSRPLMPLVRDGRFLEGLYYRLNMVFLTATVEREGLG
jgi:hypothetical protein